jgi:hypothetical protein
MYNNTQFETDIDDPVRNGPMGQIPGQELYRRA